ncbi:MAG: sulfatase-like hydrolase/transferase [Phycisphaeraceae bacterium]|nr:sulfatase-like hydrolase/transferase [Phycisphaeraceae bacterium]
MPRPNILWFCADHMRADALGCYGNRLTRTPNIDRLAAGGVVFDRCFSQSPICTPSRVSFLTGRYPRTARCAQNGQAIPADEVLVTKLLADAGYTCGLSGKLHISPCQPIACPISERRIDDGYTAFHWSHHPFPDWPGNEYIRWLKEKGVTPPKSFQQDSPYQGPTQAHPPFRDSRYVYEGTPEELHPTTWCAEKAARFIEGAAGFDRPWLFSINTFDPHPPFDPPLAYLERYLDRLDEIPLPNYVPGELENKPIYQQRVFTAPMGLGLHAVDRMTADEHRLARAAYYAMVDLIDAGIGRILAALERTGQLANTIVIVMSDHGHPLADHGTPNIGPYFYEPAVRVPLIVSGPGHVEGGRRSDAMVELMDLAPTLLEAADLPRAPGMQAQSLWPLLKGRPLPQPLHDDVFCEYYARDLRTGNRTHATMLRTEQHKLVAAHSHNTGELYDLEADPNETFNRWDDPAYQPVKVAMLSRLCDRLAGAIDPLPPRQAYW